MIKNNIIFYFMPFLVLGMFTSISARPLKRVLIMDIQNIDRDANYAYLEKSITDALKKKLSAKFAYKETSRSEWLPVAKDNYLKYSEDYHTKTVGLILGALLQQDVVITGGFTVEKKTQRNRKTYLSSKVFILDMSRQDVIAEIKLDLQTNASIFDSVDKLASIIAKKAELVLPNKEDFLKNLQNNYYDNRISLLAGYSPITLNNSLKTISSGSLRLKPGDFENSLYINAGYQRTGMMLEELGFWLQGGVHLGKANYTLNGDTSLGQVSASNLSSQALAGILYQYFFSKNIFASGKVGGGYYLGQVVLDFAKLTSTPTNNAGDKVSKYFMQINGPLMYTSVSLGYNLTPGISLELGVGNQTFFTKTGTSSSLITLLSIGKNW